MRLSLSQCAPIFIATGVLATAALVEWGAAAVGSFPKTSLAPFTRLENLAYDWRVRLACSRPQPNALSPMVRDSSSAGSNLALVFIDEPQLQELNAGPDHHQWPWPRFMHGELVRRLHKHGAKAVAFDIAFIDEERSYAENWRELPGRGLVSSDAYFATALKQNKNVVLGVPLDTSISPDGQALRLPSRELMSAGPKLGHTLASLRNEVDGVHRRIRPFFDDPVVGRVWQLGLVMAATALGVDLQTSQVASDGSLHFRLPDGTDRRIPLDEQGRMLLDWRFNSESIGAANSFFAGRQFAFLDVLGPPYTTNTLTNPRDLTNSVVLVASTGIGANIADIGPSPIAARDWQPLVHLNVANALLQGRFHTPHTRAQEFWLTALFTLAATALAWRARWLTGILSLVGLAAVLMCAAVWLFLERRYWLPVAMPLGLGGAMTFGLVALWRVLIEERRMRRLKRFFARVVSPKVLDLLEEDQLPAGGVLRELTVVFSDIRGFTRFTDKRHAQTDFLIRQATGPASNPDAMRTVAAEETLATVNLYLGAIARVVKAQDGTIDKFIGDAVMAFWGAPVEQPRHASEALRAAIAIQQEIKRLNSERMRENERREIENTSRTAAGLPALPELPILEIGIALHTGLVTVGFMGGGDQISNYTVFGREVNIAARLEALTPPGEILLSDATRRLVLRDDPDLAALCISKGPSQLRGIAEPVLTHEVLWRQQSELRRD